MNNDETLRQEVADELNRLVDLSADLRQAMRDRDPEKILEVVARGESRGVSPALISASPDMLDDERIGPLARRLRRLQESNRLLASAFQKLYRQILRPAQAGDPGVYGRSGLVQAPLASPLLIRQIG